MTCNYCKSPKYKIIFSKITNSKEYRILECQNCSLCYLHPQPSPQEISDLYKKEYFSGPLGKTGYTNYQEIDSQLYLEAEMRLKLIKSYLSRGTLLDIGCGYGHFLKT